MFTHFAEFQTKANPTAVFAQLDDVAQTPRWLSRCVSIAQTSGGDRAVGTTLLYTYREGSREGTMTGRIAVRDVGQALRYEYSDKLLDVTVAFQMTAKDGGCWVRHDITIAPKSFFMKFMMPLIGMMTRKQTAKDMATLQGLLDQF